MDMIADFGTRTFDDATMKKMLAPKVYDSIQRTRREGKQLDSETAEAMASAILKWAVVEQGATHYIHWFQPLTDTAAGKAESFLEPMGDGTAIVELSPKALVQGEPDASSFPSGGIRNTFEARGYTAWDPTSTMFVKDHTLYIPTAFCGYNGEVLDHKMPLLRSMDAVSATAVRMLRALGDTETARVVPKVGAEQEYFIIDRERYEARLDLKICGRTLVGAPPPKSQELDDHYYGRVRIRIAAFMKELDEELWAYGIAAKTKHNEVAPTQHEIACVYDTASITCDNNHLVMQVIKEVAKRHGLAALLHEKPFNGVNGSGKHNNYSLATDKGVNLLSPGKTPEDMKRFTLILACFVRAVDRYSDLLRLSTATPGNDYRLGGYEAPPATISMFLGDALTDLLRYYGEDKPTVGKKDIDTGISAMGNLFKDDSDRNRTSPFAFTGNKFEFRMLSSSQSIAFPNTVLNCMMAETFDDFADIIEKADDRDAAVTALIRGAYEKHSRIIFNGNNYAPEWQEEAKNRGLLITRDSLDSFGALSAPKNVKLFSEYNIFSERECYSRYEVLLENFQKIINIEARTLLEMVRRQVIPALIAYAGDLGSSLADLKGVGIENRAILAIARDVSDAIEDLEEAADIMQEHLAGTKGETLVETATYMRDIIRVDMQRVRDICDAAETITGEGYWPMPTYTDLMHRV